MLTFVIEIKYIGHQVQGVFELALKQLVTFFLHLIKQPEISLNELTESFHPWSYFLAVFESYELFLLFSFFFNSNWLNPHFDFFSCFLTFNFFFSLLFASLF